MHGVEPLRGLEHFPPAQVAEADFEDVEVERRMEIVAERPFAGEVVDPGDDAAFVVDVFVARHRHPRRVVAAADLHAGVESEQARRDAAVWSGEASPVSTKLNSASVKNAS